MLHKYEKINECGLVSKWHCEHCSSNNYPKCDTKPRPENVKAAEMWIRERCWERKTINRDRSSYGLKHDMEFETGIYVTNGDFITAATNLGYKVKSRNYPNVYLNIGVDKCSNRQRRQYNRRE